MKSSRRSSGRRAGGGKGKASITYGTLGRAFVGIGEREVRIGGGVATYLQ